MLIQKCLKLVLLLVLFSMGYNSKAQIDLSDSSVLVPMFSVFYSFQIPGADMADQYGVNSVIGGDFKLKTTGNWVIGIDYNYIFGSNVKNGDSLISNMLTSKGEIIDGNGTYAVWDVFERGYSINLKFGKLIPVFSSNPNSGILLLGGAGYLQHKSKFEVEDKTAPQLRDDYNKGYDKLRSGFSTSEFIGYLYMGSGKIVNLYAGFEFTQAWTKDRRKYNFNDMQYTDGSYFDIFYGIKIGWFIPLHKRTPKKYYYY